MEGTRIADMVTISMADREEKACAAKALGSARQGGGHEVKKAGASTALSSVGRESVLREKEGECPHYTDRELGKMVRLTCAGWGSDEVGEEMGMSSQEVAGVIREMEKKLVGRRKNRR